MSMDDMGVLLDTFAAQPLDFYGALRAATYDGQIRAWIRDDVVGGDLADEDANMAELSRRLINRCVQGVERSNAARRNGGLVFLLRTESCGGVPATACGVGSW
jgi:hypothetical protein